MDPGAGAYQSGQPPPLVPPVRPDLALAWPVAVQFSIVVLITASAFFVLGRWSLGWTEPRHAALDDPGPALNLNRATKAELRLIPGLGDVLAQRVIDHRQRNGTFRSVDDLRQVAGIGPKTLERIRPHLFVANEEVQVAFEDDEMPPPDDRRSTPRAAGPSKKVLELKGAINVNRASQAELQKLPGIGPKLSQRILDERGKASFKSVEDLRRVPGIGPKTLEKLRPHVTIDDGGI